MFSQSENQPRFGLFIAPTLGLDHSPPDSDGENDDLYNDLLPLIGGIFEFKPEETIYSINIGLEPMFNWGYSYAFTVDLLLQSKYRLNEFFKFDIGIGAMSRNGSINFSKSTYTQNGIYLSISPELRLKCGLMFAPSFCAGWLDHKAKYGDSGDFWRAWGRISIGYLF